MGWLYVCTQDEEHPETATVPSQNDSVNGDGGLDERSELIALGISSTVISQYDAGVYTSDQIQKIKEQKRHVQKIISDALMPPKPRRPEWTIVRNDSKKCVSLSEQHSMAVAHKSDLANTEAGDISLVTIDRARDASKRTSVNSIAASINQVPPCRFKCCHACRSFLRERLPMSIDAVLANEISPFSTDEADHLHIIDASIARTFHVESSPLLKLRTMDSRDEMNHGFRPLCDDSQLLSASSTSSSSTSLTHLSTDEQLSDEELEGEDIATRLHRLMTGSNSRCVTRQFDQARPLRRVSTSIGCSSPTSTCSTLSTASHPATPKNNELLHAEQYRAGTHNHEHGHGGYDLSPKCNISTLSFGSEIEVDGGVALTEEAVVEHMPDIMTQA